MVPILQNSHFSKCLISLFHSCMFINVCAYSHVCDTHVGVSTCLWRPNDTGWLFQCSPPYVLSQVSHWPCTLSVCPEILLSLPPQSVDHRHLSQHLTFTRLLEIKLKSLLSHLPNPTKSLTPILLRKALRLCYNDVFTSSLVNILHSSTRRPYYLVFLE